MLTAIYFYAIAALILIFALLVITCRNPVHAVLSLIMVFINASVLFLMANAEFLAMSLVIVYVGAVAVLFLFVVMMLDINIEEVRGRFASNAPLGVVVAIVFLLQLLFAISYSLSPDKQHLAPAVKPLYPIASSVKAVAELAYGSEMRGVHGTEDRSVLGVHEDLSTGETKQVAPEVELYKSFTNSHQLGSILYTDYFVAFQLSGIILLLAMIGAIVLTHRKRPGVKRQNIGQQLARDPQQTIKLTKPEIGKGVTDVYFN